MKGVVHKVHRSALADELRNLSAGTRKVMRVPEPLLWLIEGVVITAKILTDPDDLRPWSERLETYPWPDADEAKLTDFMSALDSFDADEIKPVIEEFMKDGRQRFILRLLGQGGYDRLLAALRADGLYVLGAVQKGIEALRPLAVSVQDALEVLPATELERSGLTAMANHGALALIGQFNEMIAHVIEDVIGHGEPFDPKRFNDAAPSMTDLLATADTLRAALSNDLVQRLAGVNRILERKVRGASEALYSSTDGPSQAANSLVELTDRLLRRAGDGETVLHWVERYPGPKKDLTYQRDGTPAPTKRAQALHFLYGGSVPEKPEPLPEALASAIVAARADLQKFKHADGDLDEDRVVVEQLMKSVHGSLSVGLRLAMVGLNLSDAVNAPEQQAP